MFKVKGWETNFWSVFSTKENNLVLWNESFEDKKSYFELTHAKDELKVGDEFIEEDDTFRYLLANYQSQHYRDSYVEVSEKGTRSLVLKDADKLSKLAEDLF